MADDLNLRGLIKWSENRVPWQSIGKIIASRGMVYEASVPRAVLGSHVEFETEDGEHSVGEVVAIQNGKCMLMPYN